MAGILKNAIKYIVVLCFVYSVLLLAQSPGATPNCTLAGSWYGGSSESPVPYYHGVFTPLPSGGFSGWFQPNFTYGAPYLAETLWTGEVFKTKPHTYEGYFMSMWLLDPNADPELLPPGVDTTMPEIDFITNRWEMIDCNTIQKTIEHWYAYYNFTSDIVPLSKESRPPDFVWDINPPFVEIYHRMPSACPGCPFTPPDSSSAAMTAEKPRKHRGHRK